MSNQQSSDMASHSGFGIVLPALQQCVDGIILGSFVQKRLHVTSSHSNSKEEGDCPPPQVVSSNLSYYEPTAISVLEISLLNNDLYKIQLVAKIKQ